MLEVLFPTLILIGLILLGFFKIIRLDKGVYLQDIRLFFLMSFALYSVFLPVVYCIFPQVFIFDDTIFATTIWLYASAVLAFDIVLFRYGIKWENPSLQYQKNRSFKKIIFILIILVAYSFYYMYSQGVSTFSLGENMDDRTTYGESVHQSWIILAIIIAAFFNYLLFYLKKINRFSLFVFIFCLIFYISYQVSLGNRREYTTIILFFICYYLCVKSKPLGIKFFLLILVAFIGSFCITIIRDSNTRDLDTSQKIQMAVISNEFVYPQQTTYFTLKTQWDYRFGSTYTLLPVQIAIPRAIYPNKPPTLGTEFVYKIMGPGGQGYAYTPVTEAYLNFWYIGPFIVFLFLSVFLNKLVKSACKYGVSFKYMVLFAYVFDFCRGEFSSVAYSLMFFYLSYRLLRKLSSI